MHYLDRPLYDSADGGHPTSIFLLASGIGKQPNVRNTVLLQRRLQYGGGGRTIDLPGVAIRSGNLGVPDWEYGHMCEQA